MILDHAGIVAEGVIRDGDAHILKTRFPFQHVDSNAPFRDLVHQMGPDKYQQIGGLLKRPHRTVTTIPTSGWSGEIAVLETSPNVIYCIGKVNALPGYYSSVAITAGSATTTVGSTVAVVTDLSGLYIDRVISIAGADAAGVDLITRILDIEIALDGTKKLHLFHAASTAATGLISPVSPVIESSMTIGRYDAVTAQLALLGGAGGNDIFTVERNDGVANTKLALRLGSGTAIFRALNRNLMTLTAELASISARYDAGISLTAAGTPSSPPAGLVHLYPVSSGGKIILRALFPSGAAQTIATEP